MGPASSRGSLALFLLLVSIHSQLGGCMNMNITTLLIQEGNELRITCTVNYTNEKVENLTVFLHKNVSSSRSPETSLMQVKPKWDASQVQLVYKISPVTEAHGGTYQCSARSMKPDMQAQGHIFSISVTGTGNYTVDGVKLIRHLNFSHNRSALSSGFLQEQTWVVLVTSLLALQVL